MLRAHLKPAPRIYSQLKFGSETRRPVLEILKGWEKLSAEDIEFLKSDVGFTLVTIPEALAIEQLDDILAEMDKHGFRAEKLIVNNVIKEIGDSAFLKEKSNQQKQYLEAIYRNYSHMQIVALPLFPHEIKGMERLQEIERSLYL